MQQTADEAVLQSGHYARKQLFSRSRIVAWSHTRRFQTALQLSAPFAGGRLLDYGCGDGTFLTLARGRFVDPVGADIEPLQVSDCERRLSTVTGAVFETTAALRQPEWNGRFDLAVCMEVLEHCPDEERRDALVDLVRLLASGGALIVSVPLESGASLIAKQAVRAGAAAIGLREYQHRERYTIRELMRMAAAGPDTHIERNLTSAGDGDTTYRFTGHKGFNWLQVQRELADRFTIERRTFSPMPRLRSSLNSQVWFVCRR
jgi:2-polyprenyl-3-methyl-5-hydroxy-6-metoxy-1,4-benzoquinol methylase